MGTTKKKNKYGIYTQQQKMSLIIKQKSHQGNYHNGQVYESNGDTWLSAILNKRPDMFGAVSVFEIEQPENYNTCKDKMTKILTTMRWKTLIQSKYDYIFNGEKRQQQQQQQEIDMKQWDINVEDLSMTSTVKNAIARDPLCPCLGASNTSFGLYVYTNPDFLNESKYFIIVKNYDQISLDNLVNQIETGAIADVKVSEFVESETHRKIRNDTLINNALIAMNIANKLKLNFIDGGGGSNKSNATTTTIIFRNKECLKNVVIPTPIIVNRYNDIETIHVGSATKYGLYSGLYPIGQSKEKGVIYGHGPTQGYSLFLHSEPVGSITLGTSNYHYAFPMGIPKSEMITDPHSQQQLNNDISKFNAVDAKRVQDLYNGSPYEFLYKANPALYNQGFFNLNLDKLKGLLGIGSEVSTYRLLPMCGYLSTFNPINLPIRKVLQYQGDKYPYVRIEKRHNFIAMEMMPLYVQYISNVRMISLFGDLIKSEDETHFTLNRNVLDELLKLKK